MKKEKTTELVKEKRSIFKCAVDGQTCYYVVFINTYKDTEYNLFGSKKETLREEEKKSSIRFTTMEKAKSYSEFVSKCDESGIVMCGESPSDTHKCAVTLIYPKHYDALSEYGCFGCISDTTYEGRKNSVDGFTFFPYLTDGNLYCDSKNSGCLKFEEFVKMGNIVDFYIKKLKLNIDFKEEEVVSFEVMHISKNKLLALQETSNEISKVRDLMDDYETMMKLQKKFARCLSVDGKYNEVDDYED